MRPLALIAPFLLCASLHAQQLQSNNVDAEPGKLNEIRVEVAPPDGFVPAFQRWLVISGDADGRAYDNNQVFVFTGAPGSESRVLWEITWVNWEGMQFRTESRVYVLVFRGRPPPKPDDPDVPEVPVTTEADQVTYVYEQRDQTVPRPIQAALQKLNQGGKIKATAIDKDAKTSSGQVPSQYKNAITAAAESGIPCLVVESKGKVIRVVRNPKVEDVEAVK